MEIRVCAMLLCIVFTNWMVFEAKASDKVVAMSYNLRHDFPEDAPNRWSDRQFLVAKIVLKAAPDFLGTQELPIGQYNDLKKLLPNYDSYGVGRKDGAEGGEFCPLFYKRDKFNLINSKTIWLSETPEIVGSKGWDAMLPRIVTCCEFEKRSNGERFVVFNTHFDHKGVEARKQSALLLLSIIKDIAGNKPAIILGDFNANYSSDVYYYLINGSPVHQKIYDLSLTKKSKVKPSWTFDGFGSVPENQREKIDFIFTNKPVIVSYYRHLPQPKGNKYASDHLAVIAKFEFGE